MTAPKPELRRIVSDAVPELGIATWSNAMRIGNEVVMSGMTANPETRQSAVVLGTYEQTLVVLGKLLSLVTAAGGHVGNVYKLVIYITDMSDKDEVSRARKEFFSAPYPCSTLVEVKGLVFPELKVEIDGWARLDIDRASITAD